MCTHKVSYCIELVMLYKNADKRDYSRRFYKILVPRKNLKIFIDIEYLEESSRFHH